LNEKILISHLLTYVNKSRWILINETENSNKLITQQTRMVDWNVQIFRFSEILISHDHDC